MGVLAHEIGHALCHKRHCNCFINGDKALRELHAMRFSLRFMLRYKLTAALRQEIKSLSGKYKNDHFRKATKLIKKEKIWRESLRFIRDGKSIIRRLLNFLGVKP